MFKKLLSIVVLFTWMLHPAAGRQVFAGASPAARFPSEAAPATAGPASAIVVDDLSDQATGGDGLCSLREAIANANTASDTSGGDCAAGGSGLDTITFSASGTITLTASLPFIDDDLVIDGGGQQVTIDGANTYQVMVVNSAGRLNLNGLTIADGACNNCNLWGIFNYGGGIYNAGALAVTDSMFTANQATGSDASGGAIYNSGTLTVTHSIFSGNNTTSRGGGIYNYNGKLTVVDSSFSGSNATGAGGGIYNDGGALAVAGSRFSANSADSGGGIYNAYGTLAVTGSSFSANKANGPGGYGGGLLNDDDASATVMDSTFSANQAGAGGGGINNGGTLAVTNSTFSANHADLFGGGILTFMGTLTMTNSTFSGNGASDSYGGIYNQSGAATLRNTIIANSPSGGNCGGNLNADGYNLADDATCGDATVKSAAEIHLAPLADNGGATQTMALQMPSAAIDAGDDSACSAAPVNHLDQRGVTRPQGVHCDVGAFEYQGQFGPTFSVNTTADTDDGNCAELGQGSGNQDCSLREAIDTANALSGANTITFSVSGTITLTASLPAIGDDLAIDGSGQPVTISGASAYRVMVVNSGVKLNLSEITIADGYCDGCSGGGIYNAGALAVAESAFSGNHAPEGGGLYNQHGATAALADSTFSANTAGSGGGIFNSGTLTVTNGSFSANSAAMDGGGIDNAGALAVTGSAFSANSAAGGGGGISNHGTLAVTTGILSANSASFGGGIYTETGPLVVTDSTFNGNSAAEGGGGIYNATSLALMNSTLSGNLSSDRGGGIFSSGISNVTNSTLSANSAASEGGGIYSTGTLTVTNSTLSANSAAMHGAAIHNQAGAATLRNAIVANSPSGGNCAGDITNGGHNLDSQVTCGWASDDGSLSNVDPRLGPLANNGGATQTFALLALSPAIDSGDDGVCRLAPVNDLDQRGVTRPIGLHCDIGALESVEYPKFLFIPLAAYNSATL